MSDSSIELVGLVALSAFPLSLLPSYTPDDRAYVKRRIDLARRPAFSTARRVSRLRRLEPDYFLILDSAYSSLSLSSLVPRNGSVTSLPAITRRYFVSSIASRCNCC